MYEALIRRLATLLEHGNKCRRPVSSPLKDGLFELRAKADKKQARLIYYFKPGRIIIFVYASYKTTNKVSRHDIEIAKRNKKFTEEGKEKAYGLNLTH